MTAPAPVPLRKPPYPPRRGEGFWASSRHAWNGLVHTVVHQPNMKVHVVSAILVGLVGSGLPLGLAEKVTLIFCVLLVFFAEILNSALETLVDLATQEFDEKARVTKDAAAAAVLVL
ncbi:MAG TPA: diacylglycerol kinase family protein, partial [Myxococcaceae bacterium]|nr:diacylglycerol kinase family protein [Myxococcaceae bacterium]